MTQKTVHHRQKGGAHQVDWRIRKVPTVNRQVQLRTPVRWHKQESADT
jgi:hypothetical protein